MKSPAAISGAGLVVRRPVTITSVAHLGEHLKITLSQGQTAYGHENREFKGSSAFADLFGLRMDRSPA